MADCENCNEKCPQAEKAHEIALGRMYATQELIKLVKQIDSGQIVEVVRCKDCRNGKRGSDNIVKCNHPSGKIIMMTAYGFCSYGERKEDG